MHYPKDRAEWLALRHQYVSSTESAALFGLGAYCTPYELGVQKQSKDPPVNEGFGSERMVWGLRLQEAIAKGISDDYGVKIRRVRGYAVHPDCRMGASFDYEIVGIKSDEELGHEVVNGDLRGMYDDLGPGVLEIKNVDWLVYKREWKQEDGQIEAPAQIEVQVQHQLESIQTRKWSAIGVLIGGNDTVLVLRDYDPDFGKDIIAKVNRFWEDLGKGILPPVTLPEDVDIIRKIYLGSSPGKVYNGAEDVELVALCEQHNHARESENTMKAAKESIGAKILMRIKDSERAVAPGFKISATTVAEARIEAFTRPAFRRLQITKQNKGKQHGGK
jgi:predicted phage-related endonuclease